MCLLFVDLLAYVVVELLAYFVIDLFSSKPIDLFSDVCHFWNNFVFHQIIGVRYYIIN